MAMYFCVGSSAQFWPDLDEKGRWPPFEFAGRLHKLDYTNTGPHPPKCCPTWSLPVIVSVVLLMSMARAHHFSLCMHGPGGASFSACMARGSQQ